MIATVDIVYQVDVGGFCDCEVVLLVVRGECAMCDDVVPVCGPDRIREILSLRDPLWVVSFFMQLLSRTCQMSHVVLLSLSCMMQIRD